MKKILSLVLFCVFLTGSIFAGELYDLLKNLPNVKSVEELKTNDFFQEKYLLLFEQPIDHKNPESGTFNQRVFVLHKSKDAPVVFTTEGYNANYAESSKYMNELSLILVANEIVVEHRYFSKSVPDSIQWKYLTTENAAADHHEVYKSLKNIYSNKWLATGISKGGETCLLYQMYHPNDMSAVVAYVAPVARFLEDPRAQLFLENVSTPVDRKKVSDFQMDLIKRRNNLFPLFRDYVKFKKLTFRIPLQEVYDYCVMEFSFAFWQWLADTEKIPNRNSSDKQVFDFFMQVSGPEYFSIEDNTSVFPANYMFAAELGYYSYSLKNLKQINNNNSKKSKSLYVESPKNYFNKIFIPKELQVPFNDTTSKRLENFLKTDATNTFLIYGEFDPWTSCAPDVTQNKNVVKIINPAGTHATRISLLPKTIQMQLIKQLQDLLY